MKKIIFLTIYLFLCFSLIAQSIFIDNTSYISLKNGGNVYIEDTSVNAIYSSGGGFYVGDTLGGFVEWNIQDNKGVYEIPLLSNDNVYLPVVLNITYPGSGTSVKFSSLDTAVKTFTSYYNANSIGRYWTLDFSNFSSRPSGTITLNYDINSTPYLYSDLITKYYNNSNIWTDISLGVYSPGIVTFPIGTYNSNKKWTLVNTSFPLPVTLLFFKGINVENKYSHLTWSTALEIDNDGFYIEKSVDAINFESIGLVKGKGNSTVLNSYNFDDYYVELYKTYYYRLKQVDYDGKFEYSNIISVDFNGTKTVIEYYDLVGQKIEFNNEIPSGVYLKVINNEPKLFGFVR